MVEFFASHPQLVKYLSVIGTATWQTFIMVIFSTIFSMILGMPLGIILCTSDPQTGLRPRKVMNQICCLTGDNAYPDDLDIFCIKDFKGLAIQYGARWMWDIVANNGDREGYLPFSLD